jgi:tetratricopeptide (TPR) repeat protein
MNPFRTSVALAGALLVACGSRTAEPPSGELRAPFAQRVEQERRRAGLPPGLAREGGRVVPVPGRRGAADELAARAEVLLAQGGRAEGAALLVEAWGAAPGDEELRLRAVRALCDAGYENAAGEVLAGAPESADACYEAAELHWRGARRDAARAALERTLVLDPGHVGARALLARALYLAGERAAARQHASAALAAGAQLPAALVTLVRGDGR